MIQTDCRIISKKFLSDEYFLFTLENSIIAKSVKPGQFLMIKIDDRKTFLRRPFSVCGADKTNFALAFKVVGVGTKILSQKKKGDVLNVIGPLGNTYPQFSVSHSLPPIIVAGGTGIASLLFFARSIYSQTQRSSAASHMDSMATIFIGAKTKKELLFENEFKKLGCKVVATTDDGSYGEKGIVSDVFGRHILAHITACAVGAADRSNSTVIYACGPKPMLKKVAEGAKKHKLKCYISLEERMACGVGACMGCVVKTLNLSRSQCGIDSDKKRTPINADNFEYKRVCKDGPVFNADEIIWE